MIALKLATTIDKLLEEDRSADDRRARIACRGVVTKDIFLRKSEAKCYRTEQQNLHQHFKFRFPFHIKHRVCQPLKWWINSIYTPDRAKPAALFMSLQRKTGVDNYQKYRVRCARAKRPPTFRATRLISREYRSNSMSTCCSLYWTLLCIDYN